MKLHFRLKKYFQAFYEVSLHLKLHFQVKKYVFSSILWGKLDLILFDVKNFFSRILWSKLTLELYFDVNIQMFSLVNFACAGDFCSRTSQKMYFVMKNAFLAFSAVGWRVCWYLRKRFNSQHFLHILSCFLLTNARCIILTGFEHQKSYYDRLVVSQARLEW